MTCSVCGKASYSTLENEDGSREPLCVPCWSWYARHVLLLYR